MIGPPSAAGPPGVAPLLAAGVAPAVSLAPSSVATSGGGSGLAGYPTATAGDAAGGGVPGSRSTKLSKRVGPLTPVVAPDRFSAPSATTAPPLAGGPTTMSAQPAMAPTAPRIDPAHIPRPGYTVPGRPINFTTGQGGAMPPRAMHDFVAVDTGSCNPRFMRATVNLVPGSDTVRDTAAVPLGVAVTPLATVGTGEKSVQVVDFGAEGPPRCSGCRAYINPFVEWRDNGQSWECNMCGAENETDDDYAQSLDHYGNRRDRGSRPELYMGSVDFVAPHSFRPEVERKPCFVFAVEITAASIRTGAADAALDAAKACVSEMPVWPGSRAGVLCFGRHVHLIDCRAKATGGEFSIVDATDIGTGSARADIRRKGESPAAAEAAAAAATAAAVAAAAGADGAAPAGSDGAGVTAEDDDDGFCGLGPDAWILPVGGGGSAGEADDLSGMPALDLEGQKARSTFDGAVELLRERLVKPHRLPLWSSRAAPPPPAADGGDDWETPASYACTGAALAAAVAALDEVNGPPGMGGGRITLFASSLPRAGIGALPVREIGSLYGSDEECVLIAGPRAASGLSIVSGTAPKAAETFALRECRWWTKIAAKCADARVCVDTVLFGREWMDTPMLQRPSHATGGVALAYPEFDGPLNHRQVKGSAAGARIGSASSFGAQAAIGSPPKAPGAPPSSGYAPPVSGGADASPALSPAPVEPDHGTAEDGATATLPAAGPFSLPSLSARVATELRNELTLGQHGWGCIFKVRTSAGLKVGTYSCNAFPREGGSEADVACMGPDWTAMVALDYDGTPLQENDELYVQTVLLYTNDAGATLIRTHTLSLRATMDIPGVFRHSDAEAVMLFFAHQASRRAREQGCKAVAEGLRDSLRSLLLSYRLHCSRDSPLAQLILPESLKTLPLLCSSLLKSPALMLNDRGAGSSSLPQAALVARARCRAGERAPELHRLRGMSPRQLVRYLYPRVLRLIHMDDDAGTQQEPAGEHGRPHVALPDLVWPAADQLLDEGAWLVEWRDFVLIVVGKDVPEDQCIGLFGKPVAELRDTDEIPEPEAGEVISELNDRLWAILDELSTQRNGVDLPLGIVPPGSSLRAVVETAMVEDRRDGGPSYADLLCEMHGQVQAQMQAQTTSSYDFL